MKKGAVFQDLAKEVLLQAKDAHPLAKTSITLQVALRLAIAARPQHVGKQAINLSDPHEEHKEEEQSEDNDEDNEEDDDEDE